MNIAVRRLELTAESLRGSKPRFPVAGNQGSLGTKFTWHSTAVSAVGSCSVPAIAALRPNISPAPAIFKMSTFPSRELVDSFTFPRAQRKHSARILSLNEQSRVSRKRRLMADRTEVLQHVRRQTTKAILSFQFAGLAVLYNFQTVRRIHSFLLAEA
jgi:hypothetical protein